MSQKELTTFFCEIAPSLGELKFEKYHHSNLETRISTPRLMGTGMWFVGGMPRTHGPLLALLQLNDAPKGRSQRCSKML